MLTGGLDSFIKAEQIYTAFYSEPSSGLTVNDKDTSAELSYIILPLVVMLTIPNRFLLIRPRPSLHLADGHPFINNDSVLVDTPPNSNSRCLPAYLSLAVNSLMRARDKCTAEIDASISEEPFTYLARLKVEDTVIKYSSVSYNCKCLCCIVEKAIAAVRFINAVWNDAAINSVKCIFCYIVYKTFLSQIHFFTKLTSITSNTSPKHDISCCYWKYKGSISSVTVTIMVRWRWISPHSSLSQGRGVTRLQHQAFHIAHFTVVCASSLYQRSADSFAFWYLRGMECRKVIVRPYLLLLASSL